MVGSLARAWRIARTGACFAYFGACALTAAFVLIPASHLLARIRASREPDHVRSQRVLQRVARSFCRVIRLLGVAEPLRIDGAETLASARGRLIVANHPTLIDAVVLVSLIPQLDCVVKQAHDRNPFMRHLVAMAGYIRNDGGEQVVTDALERLAAGRNLLIFPEGTRSPRGGLQPFQRGAAHLALRSGRDPLPVVIRCRPPTLMKQQAWYQVPDRAFEISLRVGAPIAADALRAADLSPPRAARRLTAELREFYEKALGIAPPTGQQESSAQR